ncbi:hypothetical protein [Streptomyces sp. NRRL S-495]|uniref:hypothetical protein n=1 Tax=Streptomyces sp. NRRL S-495 TaxID=1609133 RepID=UPI0005F99F95|nr:hypothetical protein [Streptomyces sp. NRRL S-495]KJY40272.1 hypothetical protein VR45_00365 [Streptomyces sp. NRRL S-495]
MTVAVALLVLASALVGAIGEVMTRSLRDRVDRAGSTVGRPVGVIHGTQALAPAGRAGATA